MAATERESLLRSDITWPVNRSRGGLVAFVTGTTLLIISMLAVVAAAQIPFRLLTAIIAGLGALLAGVGGALVMSGLGFLRLEYRLDSRALDVRSDSLAERMPFDQIDSIYAGQRVGQLQAVRGTSWPGYHVGVMRSRLLGSVRVFTTDTAAEAMSVVVAGDRTVVLSPADPPAFRRELIRRIESASGQPSTSVGERYHSRPGWPGSLTVGLVAASFVLIVASIASILAAYPAMPEMISLLPDPSGRPPALSTRDEIFNLPALGAVLFVFNFALVALLAARERAVSALLGCTTVLLEAVLLLATLRVVA